LAPGVRLDHVLTYAEAPSIDRHLDAYRAAGFQVAEQTARHGGGLRNGFVVLGPEYLELVWVEDEVRFAAGHPRMPEITRPELRAARRPFGIGMVSPDVSALHEAWVAGGHALPPVFTEVPPGVPPGTPPALSIQPIPPELLPGALCFALTYHFEAKSDRVVIPPNGVYGLSGVTFVSAAPDERVSRWRDLLSPGARLAADRPGFALGPHRLRWLTPAQLADELGRAWQTARHAYGEVAVLDVLAEGLDRAEARIRSAGLPIERVRSTPREEPTLLFGPGPRDGYVLAIREYPARRWAAERAAVTGEGLSVVDGAGEARSAG
jgi:hypothetical protein